MSPAQRLALQESLDQDEEIVCEGLLCYVGDRPISRRTVTALLRLMSIRDVSDEGKGVERYTINETGEALLRRPEIEQEIQTALLAGGAWTIRDDHVVFLP